MGCHLLQFLLVPSVAGVQSDLAEVFSLLESLLAPSILELALTQQQGFIFPKATLLRPSNCASLVQPPLSVSESSANAIINNKNDPGADKT
jgi:hypothetical protein